MDTCKGSVASTLCGFCDVIMVARRLPGYLSSIAIGMRVMCTYYSTCRCT